LEVLVAQTLSTVDMLVESPFMAAGAGPLVAAAVILQVLAEPLSTEAAVVVVQVRPLEPEGHQVLEAMEVPAGPLV
jgi:hypothetical protein